MTIRTRTKGTPLVATTFLSVNSFRSSCSETSWVNKGNYNGAKTGNYTTMTDVVTKGFKKRSADGDVIMSPMSMTNIQSYSSGGNGHHIVATSDSCSIPGFKTEWRYDGDYFGHTVGNQGFSAVGIHSAADITSFEREATSRCLSNRGRGSTNLFETFAEKTKSIAMLRDILLRCNPDQVLSKKNRKQTLTRIGRTIKSPKKLARIASDDYLMYRYGISPLLNDIEAVTKALKVSYAKKESRVTSRGKVESSKSDSTILTNSSNGQDFTYRRDSVDQVVVRAVSLDDVMWDFFHEAGITSKGLTTLGWELIPYSFVADWFFNIGDIIGAAHPSPGWKQLGSCLTISRTIRSDYIVTGCTPAVGFSLSRPVTGGGVGVSITKVRKDLAEDWYIPVVRSNFRLDELKRASDAAALVGQLILRRFGVK